MKIKPLLGRIIVRKLSSKTTKSGIILARNESREDAICGEVVAVGNEVGIFNDSGVKVRDTVNVGDKILFGRYAGKDIDLPTINIEFNINAKTDGYDYLIMQEEDVLANLNDFFQENNKKE